MAGKPKLHFVDGEWITVQEAADRMGLRRQQLYSLTHHKRCSLQVAVNLYRENLALHGQGRADRHMVVDGRWMSIRQAAEMMSITVTALRSYLYSHRQPDGRPATLAEAVAAYRSGEVRNRGKQPKQHKVGGKLMTMREAAEMVGVSYAAMQLYTYKHRCSLAKAVKYYETRKRRKAEKDILNILMGG